MTFKNKLSLEKRQALIVDHEDGWTIHELSIMYKISVRTVYRILAEFDVKRSNKRTRKRRKQKIKIDKTLKPCGTNAAYQRHRRRGEYPCTPCLEAHAKEVMSAKKGNGGTK